MRIRINHDNNDLWCVESKELIAIGEKYVEIIEDDDIVKAYKWDFAPVDEDDLYIN